MRDAPKPHLMSSLVCACLCVGVRLNSRDLCGGNDTSPQLLSGNGKPAEDLSKMDNKPTSTDDPEADKVEY